MWFLTAVLEKPASLMTLLTLGSSRIDMMRCSSSTLMVRRGCCCCCSMHPLLWWAWALFNAAMRALEREGWVWIKGEGVVWSLLRATLKHNSRALHWRGWWEVWWGWDLRQALLKELPLRLSKVAATCRGVSCAWPLLRANPRECFNTEAASAVRVCCNVQTPERITWPKHHPPHHPFLLLIEP